MEEIARMKAERHRREDLKISEGRQAFANLVFDYFDRDAQSWWTDRERPWRRLSRDIDRAPQTLERIISEGSVPHRETLGRLVEITGTNLRDWLVALGDERAETPGYVTVQPEHLLLAEIISRIPPEQARQLSEVLGATFPKDKSHK